MRLKFRDWFSSLSFQIDFQPRHTIRGASSSPSTKGFIINQATNQLIRLIDRTEGEKGRMGDSQSENSQREIAEEISGVADLVKELQDSASSFNSKTSHEEQSLRQRAVALDSNILKLRSSIASAVKRGALDRKEAEKLEEELYRTRCILGDGDAASFLPTKSHGRFLKMFLGPISVRATRKDVQLKVKEEYNSCRDRTALLFLLFPSALLFLRSWIWNGCLPTLPVQMYQAWLLFLYTSLALRENVLRVNGSDIRSW